MGNFTFTQGGANTTSRGGYNKDAVDRLVQAGRQERDTSRRFTIYEPVQEIGAPEVPVLSVTTSGPPYARRKGLTALSQWANFQPTLDQVRWL